jgi:hypothetical protein
MRLRIGAITRSLLVGPAVFAMAMLLLAGFGVSRAHAATDLSGTWSTHYQLTCHATLTQTEGVISGTVDCAEFQGTLAGTYSSTSGELSLTGSIEGAVPVAVEAVVASAGRSMRGSFTALPYVPNGTFDGERVGAGDASDLTGDWTLAVDGVFSGDCTVDLEHHGATVDAAGACGPISTLSGTFNSATNAISLQGPVLNTTLTIEGTVSSDGNSMEGTWAVTAFNPPLSGVFLAERETSSQPTAAPAIATPVDGSHGTPAATPIVALPNDGGGPSASTGLSPWAYVAMILGGGAMLFAGARYKRRQM